MQQFRFQLVFQFSEPSNLAEFDALIDLETALIAATGMFVDGHDSGMGEFNIFIHTNNPRQTLEQAGGLIQTLRPGLSFAAGYRDFADDDYTPLWPLSLQSFVVA